MTKKKVLREIIEFYAHPDNFSRQKKLELAKVINSNWNFGIVCEVCFKNSKSVSRFWDGLFVCKECEKK